MNTKDLEGRATITIDEAASLLGISRKTAYEAAHQYIATGGKEGLPAMRFGRRMLVPVAAMRRFIGIEGG